MPLEVRIEDGASAEIAQGWLHHARGLVRVSGAGSRVVLAPPLHIDPDRPPLLEIVVEDGVLELGYDCYIEHAVFVVRNGAIRVGDETTMRYAEMHTTAGCSIVVGWDCMLGFNVRLIATDFHPIFDRATGELLNRPDDILIGDQVWLADDAVVLKGSTIGDGAIVGVRAVVTGEIESYSMSVGVPARTIRANVRWER